MIKLRTLFAAALVAAAASAAHADTLVDGRLTRIVQFADLDLAQPAGAKVLYRRLQAASKFVCAPLDGRELSRHDKFQTCAKQAMTAAVTEIDRPLLTQIHRSHDATVAGISVASRD